MPANVNLPAIQRGDTVPYTINWSDGVVPLNMQGKTLIMTVKFSHLQLDAEASLTKTVEIAEDDEDAADGITSFQLEPSETALLTAGATMKYGIKSITPASPEDTEITYMYGDLPVEDA